MLAHTNVHIYYFVLKKVATALQCFVFSSRIIKYIMLMTLLDFATTVQIYKYLPKV